MNQDEFYDWMETNGWERDDYNCWWLDIETENTIPDYFTDNEPEKVLMEIRRRYPKRYDFDD